jgi:hypothetical protein
VSGGIAGSPTLPRQLTLPVCLLFLFVSCKGAPALDEVPPVISSPSDSAEASPSALPDREEFVLRGLRTAAASRAELAETLGDPQNIVAEVVPNRHVPGLLDTIFTVNYPDLTARFHRPGGGGELLSNVEVASNRHLRYPAIGIGRDAIEEAFGAPDEASDSSATYNCTSCIAGDDPVRFIFSDDRVRLIQFSYYVD